MSNNQDKVTIKIQTDADNRGTEQAKQGLRGLQTQATKTSSTIRSLRNLLSGLGALALISQATQLFNFLKDKIEEARQKIKQLVEDAKTAGTKIAEALAEADKIKLDNAIKEINKLYDATKEAADQADRLTTAQDQLAAAGSQAELAKLDLEEAQAYAAADPTDPIAQKRIRADFATRRSQIKLDEQQRQQQVALTSAQSAEQLAQATAQRDADIAAARKGDYDARVTSVAEAQAAAQAAKGRQYKTIAGFTMTEGAASPAEQASLAATAKILADTLPALKEAMQAAAATAQASATAVAPHKVAVQTAQAQLSITATQRQTAAVTATSTTAAINREAAAKAKQESDAQAQRQAEQQQLARDAAELAQKRARKQELEHQRDQAQATAQREAEEAAAAKSAAEGYRQTYGDRPSKRSQREALAELDQTAQREAEEANTAARRAASVMTQTAGALKELDQGITKLETAIRTLSRKHNATQSDIISGD